MVREVHPVQEANKESEEIEVCPGMMVQMDLKDQ